jgi:hypothetical protein
MHFTKQTAAVLSNRRFGAMAWAGVLLTCLLAALVASFVVATSPNPRILAIGGTVVLVISYLVARRNDSALISLIALVASALGYAGIAGGVTIATGSSDPIRVLHEVGVFATLCIISEALEPGSLAMRWKYGVAVAVVAELVCWALLAIVDQPIFSWQLAVYAFFAGSLIFGYRYAWIGKHTLDNAIDFALEALPVTLLPIRRGRGGEK